MLARFVRRVSLLASTSLADPSVLGALGLLAFSSSALANPQGGTVSAGAAAIQGQGTPVLQVNQSTDRAVIDWQSFDIAPGEVTRFQQPSASSAILNRIHDQHPSQLLGSLTANGIVALVNPNGMVFGQGSRIDVGSLIATTVDIPNERFLTGQHLLFGQPGETDAAVVNQGNISVQEGGLAALVAPQVTNTGVIQAKAGRVALGAGEVFTVDLYGDGLVSLAASNRPSEVAVNQKGGIRAEGGTVLLTTAEAQRLIDQAINMDGWVDVSSLTAEAGSIILHAAQGDANVGGKLHADGAVGKGGRLQVTGEHVKVGAGAVLTALGTYGGGDIKIGGDYLGGGTTPRARTTRIDSGATIDAGATAQGPGGRVIVWSDDRTEFGGLIQAKGGLLQGDGGFVETSSKDVLIAHGIVDASAPHGKGGEWLLDPNNITINTTADTNVAGSPDFTTTNDNAVVTVASIQAALNAGTSVSITTGTAGANTQAGNITVSSAINKTAGGDASLTLKAHNNIAVNTNISSTSSALDLTLWSDSDNSASGYIFLSNAAITTNGGDAILGGGTDPTADEAVGNASNDDGVVLNGSQINAGGGNISIRGRGYTDSPNFAFGIYSFSTVQTSGNGTISLTGIGGGDGTGTTDNAGVQVTNAGTTVSTVDGDITITGTGGNGTNNDYGVRVAFGATVAATGNGNVSVTGTGGGAGNSYGIRVDGGGVISTVDGTATVQGTASASATSSGGWGVYVGGAGSAIKSTGTGDVDVTGIGQGSGHNDFGVIVENAGAISAVDGIATVEGTGSTNAAATGNTHIGVYVTGASSAIKATGTGAVSVTGTGGGAGGSSSNDGVRVNSSGTISAVSNAVSVTGTGGTGAGGGHKGIALTSSGTVGSSGAATITMTGTGGSGGASNDDIYTTGGANVIGGGTATGDITLEGDSLNLANLSVQTTADITVQPRMAATTIGLAGGAGVLNLTSSELDMLNAGDELIIGRADGTGAITANAFANWAARAGTGVRFLSDTGVLSLNGAQTVGARDLTITTNANPVIGAGVTGSGMLTLETASAGTTMGLAGGAGTVNYSAGELTNLGSGWSQWNIGGAGQTGILTLGARSWDDPVTFLSAAAGNITVSGAQTAGAASNATFTFSGPATLAANVSTADATGGAQDITFNEDVVLTGNAQVLAGSGDIAFAGTIDGAFDLTLSAAGTITLSDDVGAGTPLDDLTITSDADPTLGGTVAGTGILTLQQASNATTMGIAGGAGTVNYSLADLAGLGSNWSSLRLGSPTATGALTVGAKSWDIPVEYRSAAAGSIVISGAQTAGAASDTTFTFSGPAAINALLDLANATGGTQAITFNDAAAANADITSGGGDIAFNDTLSPGADIATGGGDITLADDVTLTSTSSIDTDSADITLSGTLDGTHNLTLATTGDVTFSDDLGAGTALGDLAINDADDLTFSGTFDAANVALTGGTGAVLVTGAADITGDLDLTTTGTVTFDDALTYGGTLSVDAGGSDIAFNGTLDGAGDASILTTRDIAFGGNVGGVTRLGDVFIDPRHVTAAGLFRAGSFTLVNGTGNVSFANLDSTTDVSISTNGNILGTYLGTNGMLAAGAGSITGTVSFATLDIGGAGATLNAGYIGVPNAADQGMANSISIDGQRDPWPTGIPDPAYTFAGFQIGAPVPTPGGASDDGGTIPPHPITPTDPLPPLEEPQTPPVTEQPDSPIFSFVGDPARMERSALEITGMLKPQPADWLSAPMPDLQSYPYARLITYSSELYTLLGCSPGDKNCHREETP